MKRAKYIITIAILIQTGTGVAKVTPWKAGEKIRFTQAKKTDNGALLTWQLNPQTLSESKQNKKLVVAIFHRVKKQKFKSIGQVPAANGFFNHTEVYPRYNNEYYLQLTGTGKTATKAVKGGNPPPVLRPDDLRYRLKSGKKATAQINWPASPNIYVTGADVYYRYGIDGKFARVNKKPVTGDSFTLNLEPGGFRHFVFVRYVDEFGQKSPQSDTLHFKNKTTKATKTYVFRGKNEAPGAPKGLKGKYYNTFIRLRWPTQYDSNLASWNIYKSQSKKGPWLKEGNIKKTLKPAFISKKIPLSSTFYYRITAVGTNKLESKPSKTITVDTPNPKPTPVSGLAAIQNKKRTASLSWNGFKEDGLLGFYIYYKTQSQKKYKRAGKMVSRKKFRYELKGLKPGRLYNIYATSVNIYREESEPSNKVFLFITE